MDKKSLLKEYNRLNRERLQLLEDNAKLSQSLSCFANGKAGLSIRALRKAKRVFVSKPLNAVKTLIKKNPEPILYSYTSGEYEDNQVFDLDTDIKALAFYLPQFHTFPENDKWWGKGFTEWTNTKKSKPRFKGHYQPREPHDDFGYYTLTNREILEKQIKLAKEHKLYGFCFYYYWFSGKRLMEKPVDIFIENKDLNFPFCLCWANENWTRRWDGQDKEVLIKQDYKKDDAVNFIKDIKKYVTDERYIRVDGKPVILIYNPKEIPDLEETVSAWRKTAKELGIGEIEVWTNRTLFDDDFSNCDFVDAEFHFPPHGLPTKVLLHSGNSHVVDYSELIDYLCNRYIYENHHSLKPFYYSSMMDWDNSPRREDGYFCFANYSPELFYKWTRRIIKNTRKNNPKDRRFIFVNAWNEWAEGTYLEPDKKYGYLNINTLSKALLNIPFSNNVVYLTSGSNQLKDISSVALQIHAFYLDVLDELLECLKDFPFKFDLYISTNTKEKKSKIQAMLKKHKLSCPEIIIAKNRGRDIYPFIKQMSKHYKNYDYIGHIHTKKSVENTYGSEWRNYLIHSLLGSSKNIKRVFSTLSEEKVGIMYPANYEDVLHQISVGSNRKCMNRLLKQMSLKKVKQDENIQFPAGAMFWAKTKAIEKIFELGLTADDFPEEAGQTDGTIAHAIERLFGVVPQQLGYELVQYINIAKD